MYLVFKFIKESLKEIWMYFFFFRFNTHIVIIQTNFSLEFHCDNFYKIELKCRILFIEEFILFFDISEFVKSKRMAVRWICCTRPRAVTCTSWIKPTKPGPPRAMISSPMPTSPMPTGQGSIPVAPPSRAMSDRPTTSYRLEQTFCIVTHCKLC